MPEGMGTEDGSIMAGLMSRLFGKKSYNSAPPPIEVEMPPLAVDHPFVAIGDIHGCDDLLERLLSKLTVEAPDAELVFVGDYIDRGEQNAKALRRLMRLEDATVLLGNHERMCLDFIDKPEEKGPRWFRYGGLQTLASFGVSGSTKDPVGLRDGLIAAMGEEMVNWLCKLPLSYSNGNIHVVHAGADPDKPIEAQSEKALIWGHERFRKQARRDKFWVVHGHTIVDVPCVARGVVSIDTGAYATGRLSAAIFAGNDVQFIQG